MDYKLKHLAKIVISAILIVLLPFYIDIGWEAIPIIYVLCVLTKGIGSEVGSHRLWSHRSFKTSRFWEKTIIVLNTLSGEGSIIAFAGIHRLHHKYSDTDRDPHNPKTNLWGTIFYQHKVDEFNSRLVRDLISDRWLVWQHRYYFTIQMVIFVTLTLVSWTALWYYAVNVWMTLFANFLVNVVCHRWGDTPYQLADDSRDNNWADIFLIGAGRHNSHHANPGQTHMAWFDVWGYFIRWIKQ